MAQSDKGFELDIVTPQKLHFSGEVTSVIAPGLDGLFQVMKNHAPLLAALKKGPVKLALGDKTEKTPHLNSSPEGRGVFIDLNNSVAGIHPMSFIGNLDSRPPGRKRCSTQYFFHLRIHRRTPAHPQC